MAEIFVTNESEPTFIAPLLICVFESTTVLLDATTTFFLPNDPENVGLPVNDGLPENIGLPENDDDNVPPFIVGAVNILLVNVQIQYYYKNSMKLY